MKHVIQTVLRTFGYELRRKHALMAHNPADPKLRPRRTGFIEIFGAELYQDVNGTDYSELAYHSDEDFIAGAVHTLLKEVKPGQVVFDLAADVGAYTLLFSRQVGDHGRVIAFEPAPNTVHFLRINQALNPRKNISIETTFSSIDVYAQQTGQWKVDFVRLGSACLNLAAIQGLAQVARNNPQLKLLLEPTEANPRACLEQLNEFGFEASVVPDDHPNFPSSIAKLNEKPRQPRLLLRRRQA